MNGEKLTEAFKRIKARFQGQDRNEEETIDSLQDAFCRLWTQKERIKDASDAETENLLAVAARNIQIDKFRSSMRHPTDSLEALDYTYSAQPEDSEADEVYKRVDRIVRLHISDRDREILYLRDRDGWEFEEIALKFNLSEGNVRMIISRTRKTIRDLYRQKNRGYE